MKTNILEILKNAPIGLSLWSDAHGIGELNEIKDDYEKFPIVVDGKHYTQTGAYNVRNGQDVLPCILWPSENHRTWDGWQRVLFKKGDVIVLENVTTLIIKEDISLDSAYLRTYNSDGVVVSTTLFSDLRFANVKERHQFFNALHSNGYDWDGKSLVVTTQLKELFKEVDAQLLMPNGKNDKLDTPVSDYNEFAKGLVELCRKCGVETFHFNQFGVHSITFTDKTKADFIQLIKQDIYKFM